MKLKGTNTRRTLAQAPNQKYLYEAAQDGSPSALNKATVRLAKDLCVVDAEPFSPPFSRRGVVSEGGMIMKDEKENLPQTRNSESVD